MDFDLIRQVATPDDSKIVLLVMDGLGGLPHPDTGLTELETANTPNLDQLAREGMCGLTIPVARGITPGSGPGHLALFGYDPIKYDIGRGVLEALGIDFDLKASDVAARGNFCSVDANGLITDRRAGRIATELNVELCEKLRSITIPGVEVFVESVRDYRFVLVLRGEGLADGLSETDPQREGKAPLPVRALTPRAEKTAEILNAFIDKAKAVLRDESPANMVLLRGFAQLPDMPPMADVFQMKPGAVAYYPMYRGLAKLVGMTALPASAQLGESFGVVAENYDRFDFFFVHYKPADSAGEDADFDRKVAAIEAADAAIPELVALAPDVVMVAGDHSTPATYGAHSWHPVPFAIWGKWCRKDDAQGFNERECQRGALGTFQATEALPMAMAHAGRFIKYGA